MEKRKCLWYNTATSGKKYHYTNTSREALIPLVKSDTSGKGLIPLVNIDHFTKYRYLCKSTDALGKNTFKNAITLGKIFLKTQSPLEKKGYSSKTDKK